MHSGFAVLAEFKRRPRIIISLFRNGPFSYELLLNGIDSSPFLFSGEAYRFSCFCSVFLISGRGEDDQNCLIVFDILVRFQNVASIRFL